MRKFALTALALCCVALFVATPTDVAAQQLPAPGTTGALGPDSGQQAAAAGAIVGKTKDAVERVVHGKKEGPKGEEGDSDPFDGLHQGAHVAVRYATAGDREAASTNAAGEVPPTTEGVVTRVNRDRNEVTVKFPDRQTETFALTDRAVDDITRDIDGARADTAKVTLYYTNEAGHKVARSCRKLD